MSAKQTRLNYKFTMEGIMGCVLLAIRDAEDEVPLSREQIEATTKKNTAL